MSRIVYTKKVGRDFSARQAGGEVLLGFTIKRATDGSSVALFLYI